MAFERLIKRTIWEAKCKCGEWQDAFVENPPRERQCPACKEWVPYVENSVIGPDIEAK